MSELIYIAAVLTAFNFWLSYIIQDGRILGFIGRWMDKYYHAETDRYAGWLMPFACIVCRTWWLSLLVAILLVTYGNIYAVGLPFITHIWVRLLNKWI